MKRKSSRYLVGSLKVCTALLLAMSAMTARAEESDPEGADAEGAGSLEQLQGMDLEGLMSLEITSVSKQKQKLSHAAAAVSAITQEDIRRSGMTTIPELLRLAPGVHVAKLDASKWAIGTRGFNQVYQNKLLVVMDGRTLYDPTFSGVNWDSVDYMLEDLERIEVVRGPGATLWGANAVNGVININTKSARDTQGALLSTQASNAEYVGGIRYGGKIDEQTYYRIYTKYRSATNNPLTDGDQAHDGWDALRGGFRIDRYSTPQDTLTLQGDFFTSRLGETDVDSNVTSRKEGVDHTVDSAGGYLLGRWTHVISPDSDFGLQFYYDRYQRHQLMTDVDQDVWDVDFQHRFALGKQQEIIWGAGFRLQAGRLEGLNADFDVDRVHRRHHVVSAFIQDDITLIPDRLHLILGSKFEHNSHTGFEIQPSIRAIWTPDSKQTLWGSVARAIRTPSNYEDDATLRVRTFPTGTPGLPGNLVLHGNEHLASETLLAFELGYRIQPRKDLSIDVTGFYNTYQGIIGAAVSDVPTFSATPSPHLELPLTWMNGVDARTYGVEVAATWNVTEQWRLVASYSWFGISAAGTETQRHLAERTDPRNQAQLRSYYNITKDIDLNAAIYYTETFGNDQTVPSLVRVDAGVNWRLKKDMELSFGVRNLLDDRHPEFTNEQTGTLATEVPRTVYMQFVWRF